MMTRMMNVFCSQAVVIIAIAGVLLSMTPTTVSAFVPFHHGRVRVVIPTPKQSPPLIRSIIISLCSSQEKEEEPQSLILGADNIKSEMQGVVNNLDFSFTQTDFLSAAKARAAAKVESNNKGAADEEWTALADEKTKQYGEIDDWENSKKEAGNADSQILMFTEPSPAEGQGSGSGDENDDDEPKLLLF